MTGIKQRLRLSTDPNDPKYRLRVEHDDGLFTIAEDSLTSARVDAAITKSRSIPFTTEEFRWLLAAGGELLPVAEAADAAALGELRQKGKPR